MEATGDTHEQLAKHGREGGETDAKHDAPEGEDRQRRVVLERDEPHGVVHVRLYRAPSSSATFPTAKARESAHQ